MKASQRFVNQGQEILEQLLLFIDNENDNDFLNQIKITLKEDNEENTEFLRLLLIFLSNISKNHHRNNNTIQKIEQCIQLFKNKIKSNFKNSEIFKIFEDDKRILYFLLKEKIIILDDIITPLIFKKIDKKGFKFIHYLYPAVKCQINPEVEVKLKAEVSSFCGEDFDTFEKNCLEGENDSYICTLIRNDSIEEFVTYISQTQIPLSSKISNSIFETKLFLIENKPTIIEYASFFGSIQIFQYLKYNNVKLEPSLWLYAIHGKNAEIIHLLEQLKLVPKDKSYQECLMTAIKCYHNDIANYINDNVALQLTHDIFENDTIDEFFYIWNIYSYAFGFNNFSFIDQFLDNKFIILYLCNYNYLYLVKLLLEEKSLNLNVKIIYNRFYF